MLLVRRQAPEGSYFSDGDRASGVFGVIATGFSVLLGFIIFLAFTSYDDTKQGAEAEALVVAQHVRDCAVHAGRAAAGTVGWPRLLRPLRRLPGLAASRGGHRGRQVQPLGRGHVPHAPAGEAERSHRGGRVLEMARPELRAHRGSPGSKPRGAGRGPDPALDRALPDRRDHRRLHALLRRQRRAGEDTGATDRLRRLGGRGDAAPALVPRQPLLRRESER